MLSVVKPATASSTDLLPLVEGHHHQPDERFLVSANGGAFSVAAFRKPPSWIASAVWVERLRQIAIVDSIKGAISFYDLGGELARTIEEFSQYSAPFKPGGCVAVSEGFLVLDVAFRSALLFDSLFEQPALISLDAESQEGNVKVTSLRSGAVAHEDSVYSFGSVEIAGDSEGEPSGTRLGVVRVDIGGGMVQSARILDSSMRPEFYQFSFNVVAPASSDVYLLRDADGAYEVVRFVGHGTGLEQEASVGLCGFDRVPDPSNDRSGEEVARTWSRMKGLRLPVGIYNFGGRILLLTREPSEAGTRWSLVPVDFDLEKLGCPIRLPTYAEHITLIPAGRRWILIEKGAVSRRVDQEAKAMIFLSPSWIVSEASCVSPRAPLGGGSRGGSRALKAD